MDRIVTQDGDTGCALLVCECCTLAMCVLYGMCIARAEAEAESLTALYTQGELVVPHMKESHSLTALSFFISE